MVNDTISDMLTRIRNAHLVKSKTVLIPNTQINQKISKILEKEGFIESEQVYGNQNKQIQLYLKYKGRYQKPCITNLRRISQPGIRVYANHKELPKILGGIGIMIISTSKGIMTDREARYHKLGGELLCSIW
uniref:ribosomal protein S8 n=1 Tax=Symbiochloris sp. SG-2018 TaxID=2126034 RepID=UPI00211463C7|nr:ribosomal protein S8 [Symbiochloris sp. SG-2018]UTQ75711.1 ribosomal protein S8 [Symbiochloris sp. SG-2018]